VAPDNLPKPNFRTTVTGKFTDFKGPVSCRESTDNISGYIQNSLLFDGTGWRTHKCLHSDLKRTEYRMKFNPEKPFHKLITPVSPPKLKERTKVYDQEFTHA